MKKTSRLKLAATVFAVARASGEPGSPGFLERAQCVPRLVRATLDRSYTGVTPGRLALVAASAAYVASPVDLVPESVLPIIGLADDALVLSWALRTFVEETDRFLIWEARRYAWRPAGRTGRTGRTQPTETTEPPAAPDGQPPGDTAPPRPDRGTTGAAAPGGDPAAGVRDAARAYLLESVRRRLER